MPKMKLAERLPHPLKLKNTGIASLILIAVSGLAWLSYRYPTLLDITANNSNTLSLESQKLLTQLTAPIELNAYIQKGLPLRKQISQLVNRYNRYKPDISLKFIDPAGQPEQVRALDIGKEGAVVINYQGRTEKLTFLSEASLSNALLQLAYSQHHWLSFLTGHGERDPLGEANFDLGEFSKRLQAHQYTAQPLNLGTLPDIPDNSELLVIAGPDVKLLDTELDILRHYLNNGGNLLVLAEPHQTALDPILAELGVKMLPGILVDNKAKAYGVDNPSFIVVNSYAEPHAMTSNLETMSLFPETAALSINPDSAYRSVAFLKSSEQAWNETGPIQGVLNRDASLGERAGPLSFGLALTRSHAGKQQRIAVIGDGDFLSNTYLGNVGNLDLGSRIIKWLVQDDNYIEIPARISPDNSLKLSAIAIGGIGLGFLFFLPLTLMGCGFWIWRKRKRR